MFLNSFNIKKSNKYIFNIYLKKKHMYYTYTYVLMFWSAVKLSL